MHVGEIMYDMYMFLNMQATNLHMNRMTSSEPPLPLAQLSAHDELVELGASQLRFTQEETRAFLRQTLPIPFEDTLLDLLQRRTGGWITGVRLLTLALQGQGSFSARLMEPRPATINRSQRPILHLLV